MYLIFNITFVVPQHQFHSDPISVCVILVVPQWIGPAAATLQPAGRAERRRHSPSSEIERGILMSSSVSLSLLCSVQCPMRRLLFFPSTVHLRRTDIERLAGRATVARIRYQRGENICYRKHDGVLVGYRGITNNCRKEREKRHQSDINRVFAISDIHFAFTNLRLRTILE